MACLLACALSSCSSYVINGANARSLLSEPNSLSFGVVPVGETASATVALFNGSSAPVEITQLNVVGQSFSLVGVSLPVTIGADGTYTLHVQFNPAAAGVATGQLTVASNSPTSGTPVISLSGTGAADLGPTTLNAFSCSSGTITGAGTDLCSVTLSSAAPGGGLSVNLSSSKSAVTVPGNVTVPANATSAKFTANVSSVPTPQAVTMSASAGGLSKKFTLQLNAAIVALSINATSVAFGDIAINTPATQSVTLSSTGTVPVTIDGVTLTGAGFTVSGPQFPATLNPSQATTLNIIFDPAAPGAVTGQLGIASTSSTNGTAVIGLSGTGTKAPAIAVAVTPSSVTMAAGAVQQFEVSITGTANVAVTWTASGTGCFGAACGTVSSSGLYTAPATAPSPATVTITVASVSDPAKSASASATIVPTPGKTYYLAPAAIGGNDANDGLSPGRPWLSPNHSVNCGDVILAAPSGSYSSGNFETGSWGTVSCAGGNNVAWLKCATFDSCKLNASSGQPGFYIDQSYWGVQGWEVSARNSEANWCFGAAPNYHAPVEIHHVIFANNVANGCQQGGFVTFNNGDSASVDYIIFIGNAAYNAAQNGLHCYSGISIYQPIESDLALGTHIYVAGNFSWGNVDANPCAHGKPTDGEGIIFDTFDGDQGGLPVPYAAQAVAENNILLANGGSGLEVNYNSFGKNPFASIYVRNNTMWGNNGDQNQASRPCAEMLFESTFTSQALMNLAMTASKNGCGANPEYAFLVEESPTSTDLISQNWGYSSSGTNDGILNSGGFSYGPNNYFGIDPSLANPVPPGEPACAIYSSVPECMASVIADFTPRNAAALAYGYQMPSTSRAYDPLFPQWLCNVNLPAGLVTMGCLNAPSTQIGRRVIQQ